MNSSQFQPCGDAKSAAPEAQPSAAFTPGPWCVEDPMAPESLWIVQAGKQTYEWWPIAVCDMPDEEDHLFTGREVLANTQLIAAAPVLYEALKETRRLVAVCTDSGFTDEDAVRALFVNNGAITAALAKADGKQ